jgi:outer membrane protein OmpA-like peptidoglycan-associated protein
MVGPTRVRRNPIPAIVVGVVGLLTIGFGQAVPNRHSMERDLARRSAQALQAAGVSGAEVSFVGRDGVVRVASAADRDRAGEIVRSQEGVRVAQVVGPEQPPVPVPGARAPAAPAVSLEVDGGRVVLTGAVPSEAARSSLVQAPKATFGADRIDDRLTVDAGFGDVGLSGLGAIPAALGRDAKAATVELRDNRIRLTGTVSSAAAKQAAVAAAERAIGSAGTVLDELTVAEPGSVPTAPEAPTAPRVQQNLTKLPPITFLNDSATLTPPGRRAVALAAAVLKANPEVKVSIEGHTDSAGSKGRNLALSRARARAVLSTLRSLGVAAGRMTSAGFGESRPKVADDTAARQAINRRVELIVRK